MLIKQKNAPVDTLIRVGRQGTKYQQKAIADTPRASGYTQEYQEEEYEVVIDKSAAEILDEINKRVKSPYYSAFIGIPTLICGILTLLQPLLAVLFIPGSIATYLVYKRDVIRKTTPLLYEFDDEYSRQKFTEFSESCWGFLSPLSFCRGTIYSTPTVQCTQLKDFCEKSIELSVSHFSSSG